MYALREIHQLTSETLTIQIPPQFRHHRAEIIVLIVPEAPLKASVTTGENHSWPPNFFELTAGCFAEDPIERAPQGEYDLRKALEWFIY